MKFEDLDVWKRSYKITIELYSELENCQDFGFKNQITRSAVSVPSNIAEGWERYSEKEKFRFLSIAKGSCGELKTQLMIARDIGYLTKQTTLPMITEVEEISRMLGSLMNKCRASSQ